MDDAFIKVHPLATAYQQNSQELLNNGKEDAAASRKNEP